MKKNILISGAAGFLGSHLMNRHLSQGDFVFGIDNYCSSKRDSIHVQNNISFGHSSVMKYHDIVHPLIQPCFSDRKFDIVYNFACPASPPVYQSMPIETMMTCVVGTKNMLDFALRHRAILVHASTSEVYGDPSISPQSERYRGCVNSYGPRACYDEGKRAAEALCYDYLHSYGTDVRVVRIFNTYGPHMDPCDGRVVSNFIDQALDDIPLTIYGNGKQTRSFCYVDDLISGIIEMGKLSTNPNTPINLGNPNEFTIKQLADIVIDRLGGKIQNHPLPVDDPTQRCPDITLARKYLNWEPQWALENGIDATIRYFKQQRVRGV